MQNFSITVISLKLDKKVQLIEMKDVVFNVHQLPPNQLIAAQPSLVLNSDHSWNFSKNIEKNTRNISKGTIAKLYSKKSASA